MIIAKHLFDGINEKDYEGYLCLSGNHIVEKKQENMKKIFWIRHRKFLISGMNWLCRELQILIHFLPGYAIYHVGADFSKVTDNEEGCCILRK